MVKKAIPICACLNCFKALEIVSQETFQTKEEWGQPQIKYYRLRCKGCVTDTDEDSGEETKTDRLFQVRVEVTQVSPSQSFLRLDIKKPKLSKSKGRPKKWPQTTKEKPNVVR